MRKTASFFAVLFIMTVILIGCASKSMKEPPEMSIHIGDRIIEYVAAKNKWNGNSYDREDTFVTILKGQKDIPVIDIGSIAEIYFEGEIPDEFTVTDIIIDENGRPIYTDKEIKNIPVVLHGDKYYTFEIQEHFASSLSSYYEQDKKDLRGFRMIASWGDNECEYAFVIKANKKSDSSQTMEQSHKFSLKDLSIDELQSIHLIEKDKDRTLFDNLLSTTQIISDNEAVFSDDYYKTVRNSSLALYCDGIDEGYNNLIDTNISSMKFMLLDGNINDSNPRFTSPYNIVKSDTSLILDGDTDNLKVSAKDIKYGYTVENITLNCFIKKNPSYSFDIIIDPAYMHGLPVYHSDSTYCNFNVNGLNIKADTLKLTVWDVDEAIKEELVKLDSSYVYAQLTFDKLNISYTVKTGYNSTAAINDYKLITNDTDKVLTETFLFEDSGNKDQEMNSVYKTLTSNMEVLNTDKTLGITLLDLDFDTTPEVLVTRFAQNSEMFDIYNENEVADVDIYRIENERLIYIDTLYNYHSIVYELGNVIGLKALEDGSKSWFNMSYKNRDSGKVSDTDYLFTLEGNKLKVQEVFSRDADGNYYYFGELMEIKEEPFYDERFGENMIMYSWGDFKSAFGVWELIGKIKEDFCKDLQENSYNLYSDWLSRTQPGEESYKLPLTERMLSYNIALLVDSFYLGSYDANKQYFEYRFLGDYAKPVIYLYPEEEMDVSVKIKFNGELTCTYPEYEDGWNVTAHPDGTLFNKKDDREYSYLFWEGKGAANWDFSTGFVVKGSDSVKFLQDKLEYMGLNSKEINDFIVYWLPLMKHNEYNLISFQATCYENNVKLNITPKPDSILRVFMAYIPLDNYIEIPEQQLNTFNREGFTAIEWGGTQVKCHN